MLRTLLVSSLTMALVAPTASGTPPAETRYEFTQVHMGMPVRLVLHASDPALARAGAESAFARIRTLEQIFSDYRPDSDVSKLTGSHDRAAAVSADLFELLHRAIEIARLTEGAFDPTVGPLVALWREARRTGRLPAPAAIDAARERIGWHLIEFDRHHQSVRLRKDGMRVDLGGIAKGYILQEAVRTLAARGVTRTLIDAGGDVVAGDPPPDRDGWRIELPAGAGIDGRFAQRAAGLSNAALATSGPTFQSVEIDGIRYSHVVDPRTGMPLMHDRIARVIAADAATADALATALTVTALDDVPRIMNRFPGIIAAITNK
jgi:thiamine biosynthesis lipoprotein